MANKAKPTVGPIQCGQGVTRSVCSLHKLNMIYTLCRWLLATNENGSKKPQKHSYGASTIKSTVVSPMPNWKANKLIQSPGCNYPEGISPKKLENNTERNQKQKTK